MRGKKSGTRDIVDYDKTWPMDYEIDRQEIAKVLADYNVDIRHTGSTSIPNCAAKPVIDIIIGYNADDKDKVIQMLEKVKAIDGYRLSKMETLNADIGEYCTGKYNSEGLCINHTFFTEIGSSQWDERIYFKKYMIEHPEEIARYSEVKRKAAENYRNGGSYNSGEGGKSNYVRQIIRKAYELYNINRDEIGDNYKPKEND